MSSATDKIEATKSVLKEIVEKKYHDSIDDNLKKEFVFGKVKNVKKTRRNRKVKHMTRKAKVELGLFCMPRKSIKYADVLPMHEMWKEYMRGLLDLDNKPLPQLFDKHWTTFTQSIYKADFHGSHIKVTRSKVASSVDKEGICILDTKNTFQIVCQDDVIRVIPKKVSVFEFSIDDVKFSIFGKYLCIRPAERSVKKVKTQPLADL